MKTIGVILLAVLLAGLNPRNMEAGIMLSKDTPATLVLPRGASETERYAAAELRRVLHAMLGVLFPVQTEAADDPPGIILAVGRTRYSAGIETRFDPAVTGPGADSFVIRARDNRIVLVGGSDRGTLYSVYAFLEGQGCRWFMPGPLGEVIPKRDRLTVDHTDVLQVPRFLQREIVTEAPAGLTEEDMIDWAARNRINRMYGISYRNPEHYRRRGGHIEWQVVCHNFAFALPNARYFDTHPEYYALYKGDRIRVDNEAGSLCTTHPDVIRLFADFASDWFDRHPHGAIVPVSPMDGMIKWCECPECRKLGGLNFVPGPRGSMSRRLAVFANEVAQRVAERHPDRLMYLLAYQNYMYAVPDLQLESNIVAAVAHHGCYAHAIDGCDANRASAERLRQWAAMAHPDSGSPGIFDYTLLQGYLPESALAPQPYSRAIRDTIRFVHDLGGRYYFLMSGPSIIYNPLPFYLIGKLTWDPQADVDRIVDDFFETFYEGSSSSMKAYWTLLEDAVQNADWHPVNWRDTAVPSPEVYTPEVLAAADRLLTEAARAASSETIRQRIALARQSLEYARASVLSGGAWKVLRGTDAYVINADGTARDEALWQSLNAAFEQTGRRDRVLFQKLFRLRKRECPIVTLENERVHVAVIPALGGRIIRLIDKATGVNFMREPMDVDGLDHIGMFYFHYGGYEEYVGGAFAAPGWEQAYEAALDEDDGHIRITLSTEVPYRMATQTYQASQATQDAPGEGGFTLRRTLTLAKGDSPEIAIESVLANTGDYRMPIRLRVHPEMRIGNDTEDSFLHIRTANGDMRRSHISSGLVEQPDGLWATIDERLDVGIANRFDPREASCHVHYDPQAPLFNMELFGHPAELEPGASLRVAHTYRVLNRAREQFERMAKEE